MTSSTVSGSSSHHSHQNIITPKFTTIPHAIPSYTLPPARCAQSITNIRTDTSTWLYPTSFANVNSGKNTDTTNDNNPSNGPRVGDTVMVVVPGSKQVKIGKASDSFPRAYPQVIAHSKSRQAPPTPNTIQNDKDFISPQTSFTVEELDNLLDARYKSSRSRRPFPNIYSAMINYNKTIQPEFISSHNDPYAFEWIKSGPSCIVGIDVLIRL